MSELPSVQFMDFFASLWKAVNYRGDADQLFAVFFLFLSLFPPPLSFSESHSEGTGAEGSDSRIKAAKLKWGTSEEDRMK